jgi:hypothetical protein
VSGGQTGATGPFSPARSTIYDLVVRAPINGIQITLCDLTEAKHTPRFRLLN